MLPPSVVLLPNRQVLGELAGHQGMGTGGTERKGRSQMQDRALQEVKSCLPSMLSPNSVMNVT